MSTETHPFEQLPDVSVRVCVCGKWPDHHVHTGDRPLCGCNDCQAERARAQQRREDLIPEVHIAIGPAPIESPLFERRTIRDRLRRLRS